MAGKKRKRSERPTIHPRNKYSDNSPDFGQLASLYPSFEPFVFYSRHGWPSIDWTDFNATRELTRVLLLHDHGLNWWIPDGQLCPTVPNRSNYIHWIEDLLSSDIIEKNQTNIEGKIVRGFDIGTGANCIYPLLGASLLGWSFVGSDMTDEAIEWAEANVKNNPQISKLIEIRKVKKLTDGEGDVSHPESSCFISEEASSLVAGESYVGPNILVGVVLDDEKFDFCMCNPPFFEKMEESGLNPQTSCGGTPEEMVCAGGERAFIGRIIEDSVKLKRQFRWYTSMVGKKCNLKILLKKLREIGVTVVKTTEFVQGRTSRWGLAWSFVPPARKIISLHIAEKNVLSFTLEGIQKYSAINVLQTVESFFRSSGASCKSDLSTYTVNVTASSEQCTMAILRNGQEMTTKSDCEHLPANEMSLRIVVFQQNPGTLLVRGSLQHQQNPSTGKGMFTLVFQTLEETLRREFCKERVTGRRPDLGELFLETHSKRFTSSDRSPAATHEVQSKATELSNAHVQNPHMSRFEITESVFGQQTNERVIGIGSGVTPRTFRQNQRGSSSSSNSTQESDMEAVLEQNKALMEQMALMRVQQEEMAAQQEMMQRQMAAQQEMMQRQMAAQQEMMQRQMADILAKFGVPPPPPS